MWGIAMVSESKKTSLSHLGIRKAINHNFQAHIIAQLYMKKCRFLYLMLNAALE